MSRVWVAVSALVVVVGVGVGWFAFYGRTAQRDGPGSTSSPSIGEVGAAVIDGGVVLSWPPTGGVTRYAISSGGTGIEVDSSAACSVDGCALFVGWPVASAGLSIAVVGLDGGVGEATPVDVPMLERPTVNEELGVLYLRRSDDTRLVGEVIRVETAGEGWDLIANRPDDVVEAGWATMTAHADESTTTKGQSGDNPPPGEGWDPTEGYTGQLATWYSEALDYELLDELFPERGESVIVAVIDGGVDRTHPVFVDAKILDGFGYEGLGDAITRGPSGTGVSHPNAHGNAVASMVVGTGPVPGSAPNATLLPIDNDGTVWNTIDGIYEAVDAGARVINISAGSDCHNPDWLIGGYQTVAEFMTKGSYPCDVFANAVAYAEANDAIIVASAGNDGGRGPSCAIDGSGTGDIAQTPAVLPEVISVAAMAPDGQDWECATRGHADTMTPGSWMQVAGPDGLMAITQGSSMSAPLLSGIIARVLAAYPDLTPAQIRELVIAGSTPPHDTLRPAGVANQFSVPLLAEELGLVEPQPFLDWRTGQNLYAISDLPPGLPNPQPVAECGEVEIIFPDPSSDGGDQIINLETGRTFTDSIDNFDGTYANPEAWAEYTSIVQPNCDHSYSGRQTINLDTGRGAGQIVIGGNKPIPSIANRELVWFIGSLFDPAWNHGTWVYCAEGLTKVFSNGEPVGASTQQLIHWHYTISYQFTATTEPGGYTAYIITAITKPTINIKSASCSAKGQALAFSIDESLHKQATQTVTDLTDATWSAPTPYRRSRSDG